MQNNPMRKDLRRRKAVAEATSKRKEEEKTQGAHGQSLTEWMKWERKQPRKMKECPGGCGRGRKETKRKAPT